LEAIRFNVEGIKRNCEKIQKELIAKRYLHLVFLSFYNDKSCDLINLIYVELDQIRKMKNLRPIFSTIIISISFSLMGCSVDLNKNGTPALFETKIEAEKAAKNFNCTGAHKMGDKWMPCKSHADHD